MPRHERATTGALRRAVLFRTIAPAALARLSASSTTLNVPRGMQLYRSGERCPGIYLVASGRVMLSVGASRDGRKVIELIGPCGHVGLAAAMRNVPEIVTAETLIDSTLLLIPRQSLIDCASGSAELGLQLVAALSREVCALTADIEAFSLRSGRERVVNHLLQTAAGNGRRARAFMLPAKKSIIASRLNLTPEYYSRMLHELIETGAIAVNGRMITILDPVRLRQRDA